MTTSASVQNQPVIGAVGRKLPGELHRQEAILEALLPLWEALGLHFDEGWVEHFFGAVGVESRHMALPLEEYPQLESFGDTNARYIDVATELGARAVREAVESVGAAVEEVDALFFTTVTGVASPSIDAKIINELQMDRNIRRVPMFGLGCVGGAAGVGRVADYLRGHPDDVAVLVSAELCSLTLERDELSVADYIAAALFGDGAAAVVAAGAEAAERLGLEGPRVVDNRSVFYRDTEWVMGWDIDEEGFGLVLSGDLPQVIETELAGDLDAFLDAHGMGRGEIGQWISHPGGPKVLEAIESALELPDEALGTAWRSLAEIGNLSSASVLDVLGRHLEGDGLVDRGLMMAMGPGFAAEFVLLEGD